MHLFGKPEMLVWLLLLPVCGLFLSLSWYRKEQALAAFGNLELVRRLIAETSFAKQIVKRGLVLAALCFMILALAHPRWGAREETLSRRGVDIVVALDTSTSMLAEDQKPNRIEKAKAEIRGLIDRLEGDRIGLICFAGQAIVQCPLTLDYGAAQILLSAVDTDTVAFPGTNLAEALRKARESFVQKELKYKVLILLTDGESTVEDPLPVAEELARAGVRVYPIGLGDPAGAPIPYTDERGQMQYKKDKNGRTIVSALDEATLQKIALATGGAYHRASAGEFELDRIYAEVRKEEEKELTSEIFSQRVERYRWFLGVALALLVGETMVSERKSRVRAAVEAMGNA
ncbi:VWA domain-containing protein [bacterium]|nr:VWA domain-containing protein [bacterium]